jgi:hypothetical protein
MIGYTVKKGSRFFTVYLVLLGKDGGDDHEVARHREYGQGRHDGNLEDHTRGNFYPFLQKKYFLGRGKNPWLI